MIGNPPFFIAPPERVSGVQTILVPVFVSDHQAALFVEERAGRGTRDCAVFGVTLPRTECRLAWEKQERANRIGVAELPFLAGFVTARVT
jgi:hypothetical protein